jgi:hypothetical protein
MESRLPRGIDHIGLTVPGVDAASAFYERAFGACAVYDILAADGVSMAGPETEKELGMCTSRSCVRAAALAAPTRASR